MAGVGVGASWGPESCAGDRRVGVGGRGKAASPYPCQALTTVMASRPYPCHRGARRRAVAVPTGEVGYNAGMRILALAAVVAAMVAASAACRAEEPAKPG